MTSQRSQSSDVKRLLPSARNGDGKQLGRLLERYRNYLRMMARLHIDGRLRAKVDPSDIVQETFAEAHRNFGDFRGTTEAELLAWLRRILSSRIVALSRRFYQSQRRNIRLERPLEEKLGRYESAARDLALSQSSVGRRAANREQAVLLADAMAALPEHYQEVVTLRHLEGMKFDEIARRMGRTVDSVKKLWIRALAKLRVSLEEGPS